MTSGRPTRRITRSAIDCEDVLTATHAPSPVRYTLRGALLTERLPSRCCTAPSWSNVVIWAPSIIMIGSMIATSTTWPRPLASALRSPAVTAKLVASAAMPSARPNGGSVGGPSGSPVRAAKPLIASAIDPNPGRDPYGPNCPNAVTLAITRRGLAACSSRARFPSARAFRAEVLDQHVGASSRPRSSSAPSAARGRASRCACCARASSTTSRCRHATDRVFRRVGSSRVLDLDDVGTEIAEECRRQRPGEQGRGVDHPHSGQRPDRFSHALHLGRDPKTGESRSTASGRRRGRRAATWR